MHSTKYLMNVSVHKKTYWTNCVLINVSSDSHHSVWPSGVQHNRGHTHHSTLSGQWSTHPRDHLGQGMYWQYLFEVSQNKKEAVLAVPQRAFNLSL